MSEIQSIGHSYPIIKTKKIIREHRKQQSNNKQSAQSEQEQENQEEQTDEKTNQHIDEIV